MPIFHSWGWVGMTPKTKWKLISQRLIWKLRCISKSLALQIPSICPEERKKKNNALCSNTKYKLKWIWVRHCRRLGGRQPVSQGCCEMAHQPLGTCLTGLKEMLKAEDFLRKLDDAKRTVHTVISPEILRYQNQVFEETPYITKPTLQKIQKKKSKVWVYFQHYVLWYRPFKKLFSNGD